MLSDQARVSLVAQGTGAVACELCTSQAKASEATLVIQHPRAGTVVYARCARARRDTPVVMPA